MKTNRRGPPVADELLFRLPLAHVTLLHSSSGLARIELVVADSKDIWRRIAFWIGITHFNPS